MNSNILRNIVFGVEDSLVSTIGLVAGIAIAGVGTSTIIITGIVLVVVEAFSMSAGSLLSDNSAREFEIKQYVTLSKSFIGALIMFISYVAAGLLIIAPYALFGADTAFWISIAVSILGLFLLGVFSARISNTNMIGKAVTMVLIGGAAIMIGVVLGYALTN